MLKNIKKYFSKEEREKRKTKAEKTIKAIYNVKEKPRKDYPSW